MTEITQYNCRGKIQLLRINFGFVIFVFNIFVNLFHFAMYLPSKFYDLLNINQFTKNLMSDRLPYCSLLSY
jgi:hypothetical protein